MKKPARMRVDQLLVERGLAESRQKAQALVLAGNVFANGTKIEKAGQTVAVDAPLEITERARFVSRGGLKLEAALTHFDISVSGAVCLDVGSSTGGFTDCLLQYGAARVYSVDAGTAQLDWRLRSDPRVISKEQTNARYLTSADIPELCHIGVCDVSFISATLILPAVAPLLDPQGHLVVLVKPQFEVGREQVGKGGIVREPELHQTAQDRVSSCVHALGFQTAIMNSPILGAEGNREFLLHGWH